MQGNQCIEEDLERRSGYPVDKGSVIDVWLGNSGSMLAREYREQGRRVEMKKYKKDGTDGGSVLYVVWSR